MEQLDKELRMLFEGGLVSQTVLEGLLETLRDATVSSTFPTEVGTFTCVGLPSDAPKIGEDPVNSVLLPSVIGEEAVDTDLGEFTLVDLPYGKEQ